MALQGSGAISLNDIAGEFGGSVPHSITEYFRAGGLVPDSAANSSIPTSGQISFSQFYGGTNISTIGSINVSSHTTVLSGAQSINQGKSVTTVWGVCLARGLLSAMGSWGDRNADASNSLIDGWINQSNGFIGTAFMFGSQTMSGISGSQLTTPDGSTTTISGGISIKDFTTNNLAILGQFLVDGSQGSNPSCRYGFNSPLPQAGTTIFIA